MVHRRSLERRRAPEADRSQFIGLRSSPPNALKALPEGLPDRSGHVLTGLPG